MEWKIDAVPKTTFLNEGFVYFAIAENLILILFRGFCIIRKETGLPGPNVGGARKGGECFMKPRRVCALFFSPTGGTRRAALLLAEELAAQFGVGWEEFRFTTPKERDATLRFGQEDLVVAASPVYAGRLPNKLAPEFAEKLCGTTRRSFHFVCFGNRSPGDALREWLLLLEKGGFVPVGAASVACRHAFSDRIGAGRPDETDREAMRTFSPFCCGETGTACAAASPL